MAKKKVHIEYSVEKELTEELALVLAETPRFIPIKDKLVIAACFLVRMDEDDTSQPGKGDKVTIKKVAPEMQALMRPKAHYVLVVDYHWWNESSPVERRGNLRKMLSRIRLEAADDGAVKTGLEKWDIQEMYSNLELSGVYDENTLRLKEMAMSMPMKRMLDVAAHGSAKINKEAREEKPEADEPEADDPPRVVARPVPKKKSQDTAEPVRPARKIPAEPEPEEAEDQ